MMGWWGFWWITQLIEVLRCLEHAKHSNTLFNASTFAYKANKTGPGTFYGLTTQCSTCQRLLEAPQTPCSLIHNYYFSSVYFSSKCVHNVLQLTRFHSGKLRLYLACPGVGRHEWASWGCRAWEDSVVDGGKQTTEAGRSRTVWHSPCLQLGIVLMYTFLWLVSGVC